MSDPACRATRAPQPLTGRVGVGTWLRAIAAALAIQLGALVVFVAGVAVVILAMFDSYTSRGQSSPGYAVLSAPLAITAIGIWCWSGFVARRITGRRVAWLTLAAGPALYGGLWLLAAAT